MHSLTYIYSVTKAGQLRRFSMNTRTKRRGSFRREYHTDVKMGTFSPPQPPPPLLVFGTNSGMGNEFQMFLKQLAVKLAEKDQERYSVVEN